MDATPLWLALAGLAAGFLDAIIGGGGVITLPALLSTGMSPHAAIATNKVIGTGASSIATWNYTRAGWTSRRAWLMWPLAAIASAGGAMLVLRVDARLLLWAVLAVVVALALYVLASPRFGQTARPRHGWLPTASLLLGVVVIAGYDGFLGPGTGNLLLALWVVVGGHSLRHAAGDGRVVNFASNVGALAFWATTDLIDWRLGLAAAVGTVTGGWLGSRSNIRTEAKWVRPLFVAIAALLAVRVITQA